MGIVAILRDFFGSDYGASAPRYSAALETERRRGGAESTIRFLGDLQRLELKPGDKFVLTVPKLITVDQHAFIQRNWKRFVGEDGPKLLVLDGEMKLGAISVADQN